MGHFQNKYMEYHLCDMLKSFRALICGGSGCDIQQIQEIIYNKNSEEEEQIQE